MIVPSGLRASDMTQELKTLFELGAAKTIKLDRRWIPSEGAPVITVIGKYVTRGWTQWTQGFQYGNSLLCYDITDDDVLLSIGRGHTLKDMPEHLTHQGVHDHGFNTLSTYGQLYRMMLEGRIALDPWEQRFYELALKVSGAVQAARWTALADGLGFIHSFNGPQSLFIDTMRTLRVCGVSHVLGHALLGEQDKKINLLQRLVAHATTTATYNIFYGVGQDRYDDPTLRGRTAHETLFNATNGSYRAPSSQQGYSPFSTWTRGLGWAMLGFAEQLEFISSFPESEFDCDGIPNRRVILDLLERAAKATCDFYITQASASDGICYWDTGAPLLYKLGDWNSRPADPFNQYEPVDSSASAIAAQGLIRLGVALGDEGERYLQAGLGISETLLQEPYLSTNPEHEGILLHTIYHHPNKWDYVPSASKIPYGESCMWGDYHLLELGFLLSRIGAGGYYTFFQNIERVH